MQGYRCACPVLYGLALLPLDGNCAPTVNVLAYTSFGEPAAGAVRYTAHANKTGELGFTTAGCGKVYLDGVGEYGVTKAGTFKVSDPEQLCYVELDTVDMTGIPVVKLELSLFLSSASWEPGDAVRVWADTDGKVTSIVDTSNYDLDLYALQFGLREGRWSNVRHYLTGGVKKVRLYFGVNSKTSNSGYAPGTARNTGDKFAMIDEVRFSTAKLKADFCASKPCQNGGRCLQPLFAAVCVCASDFEGPSCQWNATDDCASKPCQNGGTCRDGVQSFSCACPANTQGATCGSSNCTTFQGARCIACSGAAHALANGTCVVLDSPKSSPRSFSALAKLFSAMQVQSTTQHAAVQLDKSINATARPPLLPRLILPTFPYLLERASGVWSAVLIYVLMSGVRALLVCIWHAI